jgi:hypothetical protein
MGGVVHPFSQNAKPIPKLPHSTKKESKKNEKIAKNGGVVGSSLQSVRLRAAAGGQSLVSRRPQTPNHWLPTDRGAGLLFCILASPLSFLLPPFFSTCGQLLIGSSTCPPCPDFSSNFQTSITFDP